VPKSEEMTQTRRIPVKRVMTGVIVVALSLFGLTGCSSNCDRYCDRYKECLNADLDVGQCSNKCEEASQDNKAHTDKAEECAQCVESRACSEVFASCLDDCFGVQGP
jgi:hypothetical protein